MTSVRWLLSLSVLLALVCAGSAGEKSWPYRQPERGSFPAVKDSVWVRNPIDAFILNKMEAAGLRPAREASRATLMRRLSFDLLGLPPSPEDVEAFVRDEAPDAYERLVDRLLASPQHGERWATFWLDLVRFAESDGFKADETRTSAWRYRDYVIRAFNEDKPYDRFVQEQLAGDELFPGDPNAAIATGYLRHYPDEYNAVNLEQRRQEILNDITDTTAQVFFGMTLGCARCHDHKFDPLPQMDYYRFQAFFAGYNPVDLPLGRPEQVAEYGRRMAEWEEKTAEVRKQMSELEEPTRRQMEAKKRSRFPKEYADLLDVAAEKRSPLQQQIAAMVEKQVNVPAAEIVKTMKPEVKEQWQALAKKMEEYAGLKPSPLPSIMAMSEVGSSPPATHLLQRGNWRTRGKEVSPGFLSAVTDREPVVSKTTTGETSGRRSVLAKWAVRPDHPLTARVIVNRIWQQHFGRGIVETTGDFGVQGKAPTHPELLDRLACEFVDNGWSLKHLHRLMVTSSVYRQSAECSSETLTADPDNLLFSRAIRRRLDAEAVRDTFLAICGTLNPKSAGPSIFPELPQELTATKLPWPVSADERDRNRRGVYVFVKRNLRYPLFADFDAPDRNETCSRRFSTTTAPQALSLLNSRSAQTSARHFAGRVLSSIKEPKEATLTAFRIATGRNPDADELTLLTDFLREQAALLREKQSSGPLAAPAPLPAPTEVDSVMAAAFVDLCHAILNLNEVIYID